ncbi:MAG: PstS family phosphate ABC transporter substrate-binding protein [Gammaproteobacteria bacterium]
MFRKFIGLAAFAATFAVVSGVNAQAGRGYIFIVGSSTVYPFATVVAERFGKTSDFSTPTIESTGSGGGLKLFCAGVGVEHPDIANSSRRIKESEVATCDKNGVKEITEVKIGYDGIVIASDKTAPQLSMSLRDVFLALAKQVPDPQGGEKLVSNPYKTWRDVNPDLPDTRIEVLGPPPTSGTRDAFSELAMEGGCETFDFIKAMKKSDEDTFKQVCHTLREDGGYVEAGENDNLIVQKLQANPKALGVFGFSFLDQNADKIQGTKIDGVEPEFDAISSGEYPISRPLYFYVKKAHVGVIPGIPEYLEEWTSDQAWGPDGYLADRGLIPLSDEEREQVAKSAANLESLDLTSGN